MATKLTNHLSGICVFVLIYFKHKILANAKNSKM